MENLRTFDAATKQHMEFKLMSVVCNNIIVIHYDSTSIGITNLNRKLAKANMIRLRINKVTE